MAQSNEQGGDELSKELFDELWDASLILKDTRCVAEDWFNDVKELIIQDRKQHELEARIDELEDIDVQRDDNMSRLGGNMSETDADNLATSRIRQRIIELKAEREAQ